ncbi:MAG: PLP-dependent transferase [Atopobiaceae bacterium]
MDQKLDEILKGFSKRLGAARTWIVPGGTEHLSEGLPPEAVLGETLGGVPIACFDVKTEAAKAQEAGQFLVVDNTLASSYGCPAVRLGAALAIESLDAVLGWLGSGLIAVSVPKEVPDGLQELVSSFDERPELSGRMLDELVRALRSFDERRRGASDNAQVAASYLVCHPAVKEVRYPGLKGDPTQPIAARTLQRGFGPCVDFRLRNPRTDVEGRILCAPGNTWVPGGIASRLSVVTDADGAIWTRLTCGHGKPEPLIEALEKTLR